ncbi:MAG TPA: hypothetical protein VIV11_36355 [Kofleriaceae bacterium]
MRLACAVICVLAVACDSSGSSGLDGGGDDGGIDPDGSQSDPRTIKLTLNNRPMNGAMFSFFVAYQDGSSPWKAAPAPTGDTYSFEVSAPVYGVAYGCIGNVTGTATTQLRTVTSAHFAVAERTDLELDVPSRCSDRGGMNVTLSGTVTNRPFSGVLIVQYGTRTAFVSGTTGQFSLSTPMGTHDLIVTHAVPLGNGEFYVDEALVVRDVAVMGATTRTFDFNAAQNTVYYPVTINVPMLNARALATTTLYTANDTTVGLVRESYEWSTQSLATGQMRTSDVYDQAIAVTSPGSSATITNATNAPAAQTYTPPAPLGDVGSIIGSKTPYITVQTSWPSYASTIGYVWNANQQLSADQCNGNSACTIVWSAFLSPGVSGPMPGFVMPDLSPVMGWKSAYELVNGAPIVGGVTAQTSSAGAGDFPPAIPSSGTKRVFVRSDYSVTP